MKSERYGVFPETREKADNLTGARFFYVLRNMTRYPSFVIIFLAVMAGGCEKTDLGAIDPRGNPPFLISASVNPSQVNIDSLPPVNGVYTFSVTAQTRATDPDGITNIAQVSAQLFRPGQSEPFDEVTLRDDGITPDSAANDGVFTAEVPISLLRSQAGGYRILLRADDIDGFASNSLLSTVMAVRRNSPPFLLPVSLVAPDTVTRGIDTLIFLSIAVADSDGIGDIQEVYFRNLDSPSQTKIQLLDDGGLTEPGNATSGDSLAGDGIFSIIVQIPSSINPGTFRFAFQASDTFRDTSATLVHNLVVR